MPVLRFRFARVVLGGVSYVTTSVNQSKCPCAMNINFCSSSLQWTMHVYFLIHLVPVINGSWSAWKRTGVCSATCGGGVQRLERKCNNPAPKNGGLPCAGTDHKFEQCNSHCCPGDLSISCVQCYVCRNATTCSVMYEMLVVITNISRMTVHIYRVLLLSCNNPIVPRVIAR